MIDYTSYRLQYVDKGIFYSLSGDYSGFVELSGGVPYAYNTNKTLGVYPTFEGTLLISVFFKTRAINDTLTLPYNESDILFAANDLLNDGLLKDKLSYLHDNNTYVFSNLFMANNDLPQAETIRYAHDNGKYFNGRLRVDTKTSTSIPFYQSQDPNIKSLSGLKSYVCGVGDDDSDYFVLFGVTNTNFITITGNSDEVNVVVSSPFYEDEQNVLRYGDLRGITISKNYVFITDYKESTIIKYEIGGYLNRDTALRNRRNLIEVLGGESSNDIKSKFKNPSEITSNDDYIVVHDTGNYMLKIFDTKFNFIRRLSGLPLRKERLAAMEINPHYNLLYAVTYGTNNTLNLYIYDILCGKKLAEYKNIGISLLPRSRSTPAEIVKNIEFTKNSSDYFYLCTNQHVYKLHISRPNIVIGRFQNSKLFLGKGSTIPEPTKKYVTIQEEVSVPESSRTDNPSNYWNHIEFEINESKWFWGAKKKETVLIPGYTYKTSRTIEVIERQSLEFENDIDAKMLSMFTTSFVNVRAVQTKEGYDKMFLVTGGRIYYFNERNTFKRVFKTSNLESYGKVDMSVSNEEYIQASTINKEIYKVTRDIFALKNNLLGRFNGIYDEKNVYLLDDYNYNLDFSEFNVLEPEDYFIHENEKGIIGIINRSFSNVLELQRKLLELTKPDLGSDIKRVFNKNSKLDNVLIIDN